MSASDSELETKAGELGGFSSESNTQVGSGSLMKV